MSDCHTIDCGYTVTGKVCNCSCGVAKELVPSEHIPGLGCLCGASSSFECCCEIVDWRSRREVELEAENAKLRKVRNVASDGVFVLLAALKISINEKRYTELSPFIQDRIIEEHDKLLAALEQTK